MVVVLVIGKVLPVAENILRGLLGFHEVDLFLLAAKGVEERAGLAGRHAALHFLLALRRLALRGIGGRGRGLLLAIGALELALLLVAGRGSGRGCGLLGFFLIGLIRRIGLIGRIFFFFFFLLL